RISRRVVVSALVAASAASVWAVAVGTAQQRSAAGMATAANSFLASLTAEQRNKASFPMPDADCLQPAQSKCECTKWHFIPARMNARNGLDFKEMNDAQRQRAYDLMKASLSQTGYTAATSIMQLEPILKAIEAAEAAAAPPAAAARGGGGGAPI